jgi:16S rRNA (uracil1498-N3)-methyltransferase
VRVPRLYLPLPLQRGDLVRLDEETAHYVRTVLRLQQDADVTVFNGRGGEFAASLVEVSRHAIGLEIGEWRARDVESPIAIHLGLGIARGERMDWAVQKSVELGVARITPLITERTVVQLKGERRVHRRLHWQKIAQSACEQCGRTLLPEIEDALSLDDWVKIGQGLKLFLDPDASQSLRSLVRTDNEVCLMSGPEGGFSDRERMLAGSAGYTAVSLGPRIMRTETAAIAALAAIQAVWGDLCR